LCLTQRVSFRHDVDERRELQCFWISAVNAVAYSDKSDLVPPKKFHKCTDLDMVAAKPAHVLNCYNRHVAGFNLGDEFVPTLAVEGRAADTIILKVANVGKSLFSRIVLKDFLLVLDRVAVTS